MSDASFVGRARGVVGRWRRNRPVPVDARLDAIEQRLAELDGRVNHWIGALSDINHLVADLHTKLGEAAADVEMTAALLMAANRQAATSGSPATAPPPPQGSAPQDS